MKVLCIKKCIVIMFLCLFFFFSCSKENSTSTPTSSCSFMPYKNGTVIVSKQYENILVDSINTSSVVSEFQNGTQLLKILTSLPNSSNHVVYQYWSQTQSGNVLFYLKDSNQNQFIFWAKVYLNPNLNIGESWADTFLTYNNAAGFKQNEYNHFEIKDKGFTEVIMGKQYTNCIKVRQSQKTSIGGLILDEKNVRYFYWACGVGIYKTEDANGKKIYEVISLTL